MTMKRLLILGYLAYSAMSQAGTGSGQIVSFTPAVLNGTEITIFVIQNLTASDRAGCNTDGRFVWTSTDPKYKTVMAAMMAAYFSGTSVFARGYGTCNIYGGSEDLNYMCFNGGTPC